MGERISMRDRGAVLASVIVLALALVAGGVSAGKGLMAPMAEEPAVVENADGTWTIMVYMCADNNLETFGVSDLVEMEMYGGAEGVNIVVLMDTFELIEATHWYIVDSTDTHYDMESGDHVCDCELIEGGCLEETNMGDGAVLTDFIVKAADYAPADKYMLVLWDHGGGWRGVCWDDSSPLEEPEGWFDRLTVHELAEAIKAAEEQAEIRLDIIGFDACLMSMIEVAYEVRDLADYMLGSVTGIPMDGWAYDLFLDDLAENPGMSPEELCGHVIEGYVEYYSFCVGSGLGGFTGVTLSAVDLSQVGELAIMMDELGVGLLELWNSGEIARGEIIVAAQANTPAISMYGQQCPFVDIGFFAAAIAEKFPSVKDVAEDIVAQMSLVVPREGAVQQDMGGAFSTTGMTVFLPCSFSYLNPAYAYETIEDALDGHTVYYGLDFAIDTNWDEFVFGLCPAYVA